MTRYLLVFLTGGLGAAARYALGGWVAQAAGASFPWGTLTVNVLGSFLLSGVMHLALATDLVSPDLRIAIATGFLGGFTTYSTFNYETLQMLREGQWPAAAGNVALTVTLCLAAGIAGLAGARWLTHG